MSSAGPENPFRAEAIDEPIPSGGFGMSRGAIVGLVVSAVICAIVAIFVPALAIPAAVLLTPPLVRTAISSNRHRAAGRPLSHIDKFNIFCLSVGIFAVIFVAAGIAFGTICFGTVMSVLAIDGGAGNVSLIVMIVGISIAAFTAFAVFLKLTRTLAHIPVVDLPGVAGRPDANAGTAPQQPEP